MADSIAVAAAQGATIAHSTWLETMYCLLGSGHSSVIDPPAPQKWALSPEVPPFVPTVNAFSKWSKPG